MTELNILALLKYIVFILCLLKTNKIMSLFTLMLFQTHITYFLFNLFCILHWLSEKWCERCQVYSQWVNNELLCETGRTRSWRVASEDVWHVYSKFMWIISESPLFFCIIMEFDAATLDSDLKNTCWFRCLFSKKTAWFCFITSYMLHKSSACKHAD